MRRKIQQCRQENGPIEDFSQLLYAMQNDNELMRDEYVKLLADLYDECYININPEYVEQMNDVYDKINYELPQAIKNGLADEFNDAKELLLSITETLREIAPSLVYSLPLDESAEDVVNKVVDRVKRLPKKAKYGLGVGAMIGALGLAGHHDANDYYKYKDIEPSYQQYIEDMYNLDHYQDEHTYNYEDYDEEKDEDTRSQMEKDLSKNVNDVKISQYGINLIKSREKFKAEPYFASDREKRIYDENGYTDNVGKTIGYGHRVNRADPDWLKNAKSITLQQAEELFRKDVAIREAILKKFIINDLPSGLNNPKIYSQGFIDGMMSFLYNCGGGSFRKSKTCQTWKNCRVNGNGEINDDDYNYLVNVLKNDKISYKGHIARRAEEANFLACR